MTSLRHNLYWHQRLYGTDFLHLTFFAQNTTKTSKDVGLGISIVLNICETPVVFSLKSKIINLQTRTKSAMPFADVDFEIQVVKTVRIYFLQM
jgi:hypothetical protein